MSNFLRRGKRIQARADKKVVKKSTKEFYKILGELDRVAEVMNSDQDIQKQLTEDTMVDLAQPLTEVKIGGLEKMVLMGKLGMYQAMEKEVDNGKTVTK
jgi:hypothetical protein